MMIKLLKWYLEGESEDIEDLSIWWDLRTRQFRHLFFCDDCSAKVGCQCYDYLGDAIQDIEYGSYCRECSTKNIIKSLDIDEICYHFDEERDVKVMKHGVELLEGLSVEAPAVFETFKEDMQTGSLDLNLMLEILGDVGKYSALHDYASSLMTDDEKDEEYGEAACEAVFFGTTCDI